jgi:multidrug resistance efflux pump
MSEPSAAPETAAKNPIKRLTFIVLTLAFLFLCWYVLADRFTPYTSEARVRGYVVPIAPEIAGVIKELPVSDNQIVEIGEPLLQLDAESYQLAVNKAQADLEDVAQTLGAGLASVAAAETAVVSAQPDLRRPPGRAHLRARRTKPDFEDRRRYRKDQARTGQDQGHRCRGQTAGRKDPGGRQRRRQSALPVGAGGAATGATQSR